MNNAVAVVLSSFVIQCYGGGKVDYCGARMCSNTDLHTLCRYTLGPGPTCVGYIEAPLTGVEKASIVARLNRRRSEAARGMIRGLPPAANMLKLRWVEELAREAQRWADQCRPAQNPEQNDVCRDLYSVTVGQAVASLVGESPGLRPESLVDVWYLKSRRWKGNLTYMTASYNGVHFNDWAQIIWAHTYMVGCGRSRFMAQQQGRLRSVERLVCNFAPYGPGTGQTLWNVGDPATACPSYAEKDLELPGLCNFHPNNSNSNSFGEELPYLEKLLLNSIFEIERNDSLNYLGSLDELYLTKLAIAEIKEAEKIPFYASLEKRQDIKGDISKDEHKLLRIGNNIQVISPTKVKDASKTKKRKQRNKSVMNSKNVLIGRPQSYNIDDLNDVNAVADKHDVKGVHDEPHIKKDIYNDYDLDTNLIYTETTEYSINSLEKDDESLRGVFLMKRISLQLQDDYDEYEKDNFMISEKYLQNATLQKNTTEIIDNTLISTEMVLIGQDIMLFNDSNIDPNIAKNRSEEDYLSDPETVRQLQDALDNMEREISMQATSESTPAKVRRDLRSLPTTPPFLTESSENRLDAVSRSLIRNPLLSAGGDFNKSEDRHPMMNMVMRYMPYLRSYEGKIPGSNAAGHCFRLLPTATFIVLHMVVCL